MKHVIPLGEKRARKPELIISNQVVAEGALIKILDTIADVEGVRLVSWYKGCVPSLNSHSFIHNIVPHTFHSRHADNEV